MKIIIALFNLSRHAPPKFGKFIRSNKFSGRFVYEDRSFTPEEFESVYPKILVDTVKKFHVFPVPVFVQDEEAKAPLANLSDDSNETTTGDENPVEAVEPVVVEPAVESPAPEPEPEQVEEPEPVKSPEPEKLVRPVRNKKP